MSLTYRAYQKYDIDAPQFSTANAYQPRQASQRLGPVVYQVPQKADPLEPFKERGASDTFIRHIGNLANEFEGDMTKNFVQAMFAKKTPTDSPLYKLRAKVMMRLRFVYTPAEIAKYFDITEKTVFWTIKAYKLSLGVEE
jgi:hypothetical protein